MIKAVAIDDEPIAKAAFIDLAQQVARMVAIRNANMEPTKILEIN